MLTCRSCKAVGLLVSIIATAIILTAAVGLVVRHSMASRFPAPKAQGTNAAPNPATDASADRFDPAMLPQNAVGLHPPPTIPDLALALGPLPQIGHTAPEIDGADIDGRRFKLSDYRGKVVVLDFWGDW